MSEREPELHVLRGGAGDDLLVLLHGMGANAEVWRPMLALVDTHWHGRWIAPDLRGHGRSTKKGPFDVPIFAKDIAALIAGENAARVVVAGHSFGGLIAAIVGSNDFGARIDRVAAFSVKLNWTDEDVARTWGLAERPRQDFATRAEAAGRALAFAGLKDLAAPDSPVALASVETVEDRYRVSFTPAVFGSTSKDVADAMRLCKVPLRLATGERDAMAPLAPMRALDPAAHVFVGAGHNVHWEQPEVVWRFLTDAL